MSLNVEKIINEVTRVVDGLTGELDGYDLTPKQFDYLLIQASKVEELERQNKRYQQELEFYADEESWSLYDHHGRTLIGIDGGMRARKALEGEE